MPFADRLESLAGIIADRLGWQKVFLINASISAASIIGLFMLIASKHVHISRWHNRSYPDPIELKPWPIILHLDILGSILAGITVVLLALTFDNVKFPTNHVGESTGWIIGCIASSILFICSQYRRLSGQPDILPATIPYRQMDRYDALFTILTLSRSLAFHTFLYYLRKFIFTFYAVSSDHIQLFGCYLSVSPATRERPPCTSQQQHRIISCCSTVDFQPAC